jgi:hypothetical protein
VSLCYLGVEYCVYVVLTAFKQLETKVAYFFVLLLYKGMMVAF